MCGKFVLATVWIVQGASHRGVSTLDGQHLEIHLRGLDLLTVSTEFVLHLSGTESQLPVKILRQHAQHGEILLFGAQDGRLGPIRPFLNPASQHKKVGGGEGIIALGWHEHFVVGRECAQNPKITIKRLPGHDHRFGSKSMLERI